MEESLGGKSLPGLRDLATLSEDPGSVLQHPHGNLQLPIIPVPGTVMPSSGLHGHCIHVVHIHIYRQTCIHINNSFKNVCDPGSGGTNL